MYVTSEMIHILNEIISEWNRLEDERERERFLSEHVEDKALFVKVLKKVSHKKLQEEKERPHKQIEKSIGTALYKEEALYTILSEKDDAEILREYTRSDLRDMYASVYGKNPSSGYTKENILHTLRNRMHKMKRAEAFVSLAEERDKNKRVNDQ